LTVGLVGLGGGGSHEAQQLAHVGVGSFVLVDGDIFSDTNLNRVVGAKREDIQRKTLKVDIAERVIKGINPDAHVTKYSKPWQEVADALKECDVIFSAVDSVRSKDELEGFCRRFLIPLIDQGMDVHHIEETDEYLVAGQVVLSSPGTPCLRCFGIVTEEALAEEARKYGDAGSMPQVVWPNGVLASTAVGLFMQFVTPWFKNPTDSAYLEYDANRNTMMVSERFRRKAGKPCPHHHPLDLGDPTFDIRKVQNPARPHHQPRQAVDSQHIGAKYGTIMRLKGFLRKLF
jgi:molybdopterin-synthase adenylyltransferase